MDAIHIVVDNCHKGHMDSLSWKVIFNTKVLSVLKILFFTYLKRMDTVRLYSAPTAFKPSYKVVEEFGNSDVVF